MLEVYSHGHHKLSQLRIHDEYSTPQATAGDIDTCIVLDTTHVRTYAATYTDTGNI
jgi:hypothetical protein